MKQVRLDSSNGCEMAGKQDEQRRASRTVSRASHSAKTRSKHEQDEKTLVEVEVEVEVEEGQRSRGAAAAG